MITEFVEAFEQHKEELIAKFKTAPNSYEDIVRAVVEILPETDNGKLDPKRIHAIDDGDYQGTALYIISDDSYQPYHYWYVFVGYGSCSGCDTLLNITHYQEKMDEKQIKDLLGLAFDIVRAIKPLRESFV